MNAMQNFDVIIVGSGAGGCAAAFTLVNAGLNVCLVEQGRELPMDGVTLDINAVVHEGRFKSHETWLDGKGGSFAPDEWFNIGGKTKWYGAALLRYSDEEMLADPARRLRGWPIEARELAPYYAQAEQHLAVEMFDAEPSLKKIMAKLAVHAPGWREEGMPMGLSRRIYENPVEASHFDGFASVAGLKADAERSFLAKIRQAPNLTLIEGIAVQELVGSPDDPRTVAGVVLGDSRKLYAKAVVLAAGALHSPRLVERYVDTHALRRSPADFHAVGRYLKLHHLTALIALSPGRKKDLLRKTRVLLNDAFPRSSIQPLGFDGELIATLMPKLVPGPIRRVMGDCAYGFFLQTEDEAHPDNRVIDGKGGSSTMDYDENRSPAGLAEHRKLIRTFTLDLLRCGLVAFSQRVGLAGTAHASGTLTAGHDQAESAVDAAGRVHGLHSLYAVDGSVLPRSSRVNPSLSIFAWSLRVAEMLAGELRTDAHATESPRDTVAT